MSSVSTLRIGLGHEGSPFAPDANDRFRAGLGGCGEGAGGEGDGRDQQVMIGRLVASRSWRHPPSGSASGGNVFN